MGFFDRQISLEGFEAGLAAVIAAEFTYGIPNPPALKVGRDIFWQDMPEADSLKDDAGQPIDGNTAITLGIYTEGGPGVQASTNRGHKHEWSIELLLRNGVVPEVAKERLEEVVRFLMRRPRGRIGKFVAQPPSLERRPANFTRAQDGHAYASAVLKFLVVPLPQ